MKALVMGAGIAGMTTAYELLKDGYEVTVVDREKEAANFTSFANAGLFAPGHSYAWSSPAAPMILFRSLWRNDQALRFKPSLDPALWRWMIKFWGQCTAERARINTSRKVRLSNYSLNVFTETLAATGIEHDGREGGLVYLYRSPASLEAAAEKSQILVEGGCTIEIVDADGAAKLDPALEPVKDKFAGALYARDDRSGDCRKFAHGMADWLKERGVTFKFGTTIERLETEGDRISAAVTDKGRETADVYVLSLGIYSPHLAKQLGYSLPIYPVKGYSVTVPVAGRNNPPERGGVDEENLVAYCPLGDRLRITATAEFSGYDTKHSPSDFRHMLAVMRELFPNGADYDKPDYWAGLRPMTPEGTPILGRGKHDNLWYNTGQGHMGWTMSHGAARITADLVAGRKPAIDLTGMTLGA